MVDIPATEKQLAFLKQLTGKDYSDFNLTAKEASRKIEEVTGKEGNDKPSKKTGGRLGSSDASIEGQVGYHYVMEAFIAGKLAEEHYAVHTALGWAVTKMGGTLETIPSPTATKKETEAIKTPQKEEQYPELKNIGQLFSRCLTLKNEQYPKGVSRQVALNILGVKQVEDIDDLDQAWQIILATVK